jgi:hypothetical protein
MWEGITGTYETIEQTFGIDSLSRAQVFQWHADFANGQEQGEHEMRPGRPVSVRTSTRVDSVWAFIRQNRRLTIRMIGVDIKCTVHQIHKIC